MSMTVTTLTETLGAFVGVVGLSIAVWLQLVTRKRTPPRYVFAFFTFGAIFLLINVGALNVPARPANLLGLLGVSVALVFEVGAAVYVYRRFGVGMDSTTEYIEGIFHELR